MAATTASDDSSALTDRTNAYLKTFNSHRFKADELKNAVPIRPTTQYQSQLTENYTRFTQDATSLTGVTGQSDSGLVMDPEDRERAGEDLAALKDFVSALKFAYLESDIKLQFVSHIMSKDGPALVSMEDNAALERERLRTKAELKERKLRAAELESLIRTEAELLDERLQLRSEEAAVAAQLLRDCEAMETEIAMLKNKRSPVERITIEEAQALCEGQESRIATFGPEIKACEAKMKETKSSIRAHKAAVEKLAVVTREMTKEQEEREGKGERDERAEEACRWITNATALYSSLVGIRSAQAVGVPPTEMRIEYESPQGNEGDYRTLSIALGEDGRMTGARLVDSSEDIQDIVEAYLPSQDLRSLVQEVRARMAQ